MEDKHTNDKNFLTFHDTSEGNDSYDDESNDGAVVSARQRASKAINKSLNGDEVGAREEVRQICSLLDAAVEGSDVE